MRRATTCLALALAVLLPSADAAACSPWDGWGVTVKDGETYPANAAVLLYGTVPQDFTVTVNESAATLVPADFPWRDASFFISPLPAPGASVHLASADCPDHGCDKTQFIAAEPDETPPRLSSLYFDIHDHPGVRRDVGGCGNSAPHDLTFLIRLEVSDTGAHDYAFIELRSPEEDTLLARDVVAGVESGTLEIPMSDEELRGVPADEVCVSVRLTDTSGNALTPVTSCTPCRVATTATDEEPDWSDATLHPDAVCSTPAPTPERLPGMAPLPNEPSTSGCSVSSARAHPSRRSWWLSLLAVAALGLRRAGRGSRSQCAHDSA